MRVSVFLSCLCTVAIVACDGSGDGNGNPSSNFQTVQLEANSDGTLGYCDTAGTCSSLPNPDNCKTLTISIDTGSGQACQVCTTADGTEGPKNCNTPAVACQVITIPNPDCVVCAYVNGTVIFSSCQPSAPLCYTTYADGSTGTSGSAGGSTSPGIPNDSVSAATALPAADTADASPPTDAAGMPIAPPIGCTICIDQNDNRISQDCPPDCRAVACTAIACGPGYQMVTNPGECCGHCEPISKCDNVMCPMYIPICPDGQVLTQDPTQCCSWHCEPVTCDGGPTSGNYACPEIAIVDCAPGYVWSTEPPHCCGACVPAPCKSNADCGPDQTCIQPPCACIPNADGSCTAPDSCVGQCLANAAD